MNTLLLRFAGPLQAWGTESKFEIRRTESFPTKSGIIGMIASALGRRRNESIEDLNLLRIGVRIDQEGKLLHDFHTARKDEKASYVTHRYYLSDAVFLVGIESEDCVLLEAIKNAFLSPVFPLYLGRRSCPPTFPLLLGIKKEKDLLCSLREEPWLVDDWRRKQYGAKLDGALPIYIETDINDVDSILLKDRPVSFNPMKRQFSYRGISHKGYVFMEKNSMTTEQNPFEELR